MPYVPLVLISYYSTYSPPLTLSLNNKNLVLGKRGYLHVFISNMGMYSIPHTSTYTHLPTYTPIHASNYISISHALGI